MAFLLLGIGYLHRDAKGAPNPPIIKAGGYFGLFAAFMAWYNALAGIADSSNSYVSAVFFPRICALFLTNLQFLHHSCCTFPVVLKGSCHAQQDRTRSINWLRRRKSRLFVNTLWCWPCPVFSVEKQGRYTPLVSSKYPVELHMIKSALWNGGSGSCWISIRSSSPTYLFFLIAMSNIVCF